MPKSTRPKARIVRKFGTNIFGSDKYDKILQRKPQPPGKGPRSRIGRKSEYAQQLNEKQKMREMYCLSEKQFRSIYEEASKAKGQVTGDVMKQILERNLSNAVFRAGFAMTRPQARQMVSHGLLNVNGRRVTVPSYRLRTGDVISVRERSKNSPVIVQVLEANQKYMPPNWLKVDPPARTIEVTALPEPDNAEQGLDVQQVIEFYSRN